MSISLTLELNDRDLKHFEDAMEAARTAAAGKGEAEIVDCAAQLLQEAQGEQMPDFIVERLLRLDDLIAMVRDEGWAMPDEDRQRVLSALTYFCEPADVIPDHIKVLGFLDDAVMIELCVRDLKHELDAYDEFCEYRQREADRRSLEPAKVGRADWLGARRDELVERMHRRRERDTGAGYGKSSGYASGKRSYSDRGWRPGLFRAR
jgi:uncharacterized membrane protein YkvA (DUF1232 family)